MIYRLEGVPPSNNKFIGRENRWAYQNVKKGWASIIAYTCLPRPTEPIKRATVTITYHFPDRRRRDPDNYSGKMLLDGMVNAGILEDDSFNCINLLLRCGDVAKPPYTEIEVTENE